MVVIYLFLTFSGLLSKRGLLSLPNRFFDSQVFDLILERLEFSGIDAIIL